MVLSETNSSCLMWRIQQVGIKFARQGDRGWLWRIRSVIWFPVAAAGGRPPLRWTQLSLCCCRAIPATDTVPKQLHTQPQRQLLFFFMHFSPCYTTVITATLLDAGSALLLWLWQLSDRKLVRNIAFTFFAPLRARNQAHSWVWKYFCFRSMRSIRSIIISWGIYLIIPKYQEARRF